MRHGDFIHLEISADDPARAQQFPQSSPAG